MLILIFFLTARFVFIILVIFVFNFEITVWQVFLLLALFEALSHILFDLATAYSCVLRTVFHNLWRGNAVSFYSSTPSPPATFLTLVSVKWLFSFLFSSKLAFFHELNKSRSHMGACLSFFFLGACLNIHSPLCYWCMYSTAYLASLQL